MKTRNKIIAGIFLSAGTLMATVLTTALINKYIKIKATSKNRLEQPNPNCYKWRLGNIFYTKAGSGSPLLLVHDLDYLSSGCEWEKLIPILSENYTVYTLDLLGCGRSEKPNLTYTNFLYVQLISDFIKSEIGQRTSVIASGDSSSVITMACGYDPELFEKIMLVNPESYLSCRQIPGKQAKLYKLILDIPVLGTMLYNIAASKKEIKEKFKEKYFYNPYGVKEDMSEKYCEASHLGANPKAIYSSIRCNYTKCNITRSFEKIDNSIYIIGGAAEAEIHTIIKEYADHNPAIEFSIIPCTRHLPQLEKPEEVAKIAGIFFN